MVRSNIKNLEGLILKEVGILHDDLKDLNLKMYLYGFISYLCFAVLRIFYRRIEVLGLDRIPKDGPVIMVGAWAVERGHSLLAFA